MSHGCSRAEGASVEGKARQASVDHSAQAGSPAPPTALPPLDVPPIALPPFELPPLDVPPRVLPPVELPLVPPLCSPALLPLVPPLLAPLVPPTPPSAPPDPAPDRAPSRDASEPFDVLPHEQVRPRRRQAAVLVVGIMMARKKVTARCSASGAPTPNSRWGRS
jgi:hypothetical protein